MMCNRRYRGNDPRPGAAPGRRGRRALAILHATLLIVAMGVPRGASAEPPAGESSASPTAETIPDESLLELTELYVAPNSPLRDAAKLRKYELILSKGRELERRHADAPNLYVLRSIMLQAAQGRAIIEGEEESRQSLLALAGRIASSDAPPAHRLQADLLLTHAEIARHDRGAEPALVAIARLADKYYGTEVEAQSAMRAMILAFDAGDQRLFKALSRRLRHDFGDNPRVVTFLKDRFGVHAGGKTINTLLERADGGTWRLPMDVIGRPTTVAFWSTEVEYFDPKMRAVKEVHRNAEPDTFLLGVNLDTDPEAGRKAARRLGLDFPHVYRGRGTDDPVFLLFGKARIPSISYLRPDGTSAESREQRDDLSWACPRDNEPTAMAITFLRSGEFLVTRPVGPTDPAAPPELGPPVRARAAMRALDGPRVPPEKLRAIQECFTVPPRRYRLGGPLPGRYDRPSREKVARLYETALSLCEKAIAEHENAADLFLVRNRLMVALVGLSAIRTDPSLTKRAAEIGQDMLDSELPAGAEIIADMCATRWALREEMDGTKNAKALRAFIDRQAREDRKPLALVCAAMLALELGERGTYRSLVNELESQHRHVQAVRPFLWYAQDDRATGLPLRVTVPLLDGGELNLPEDWRGRPGVVVFIAYSPDPEVTSWRVRHMARLRLGRHWHRNTDRKNGLHVLYAISGATREQARALAEEHGWEWPIAFAGPDWDNPLMQAYRGPGPQEGLALLVADPAGTIIEDKRGHWVNRHFDRTLDTLADRRRDARDLAEGIEALEAERFRDAARVLQQVLDRSGGRRPPARVCMLLAQAKAGLEQWRQAVTWIKHARRYAADHEEELLEDIEALRADYEKKLSKAAPREGTLEFRQPSAVAKAMPGSRLIARWNVVGPFRMRRIEKSDSYLALLRETEQDFSDEWSEVLAPETSPDLTATYEDKFGHRAEWTELSADVDGLISMEEAYEMDLAVACALSYVYCPEAGEYEVGVGSDDHHVIRVNGRVVHKHYGPRAATPAEDRFKIRLEKGWNEILVKCGDAYGQWGFYFQIRDPGASLRFAPSLPEGARPVPRHADAPSPDDD